MTNDDRGHRSSFGCHVTDSGDVVRGWDDRGMVGVVLWRGGGMGWCGRRAAWL